MSFIEIKNDEGLSAKILTYGATLTSVKFRDKTGTPVECVLGFDTVEEYQQDKSYMGCTIGRVANRVKNGTFTFKDEEINLPVNCPPHCHHGGPNSTAYQTWEIVRHIPTSATLRTKVSQEVDGFPGDAVIDVTYTINDRNQLVVEHFAKCTNEGVLALAHHPYFNLDGSEDISDHKIYVIAPEYLPTDDTCCPTGEILPVEGKKFDLNQEVSLSLFKDDKGVIDLDHDFVMQPPCKPGHRILSLSSEKSGIRVGMSTSYPAIHLYGGKHLNTAGHNGEWYGTNKGVAMEAQYHSAALSYPNFPDVTFSPEKAYCHEVIYCFCHL